MIYGLGSTRFVIQSAKDNWVKETPPNIIIHKLLVCFNKWHQLECFTKHERFEGRVANIETQFASRAKSQIYICWRKSIIILVLIYQNIEEKKILLFKITSSIDFDSNRGNVFNKKWSKILSHRKHFAAEWHLEVLMKTNNFHWHAGFCFRPISSSKISKLSSFDNSVNKDIVSIIKIIIFSQLYTIRNDEIFHQEKRKP